MRKLLVSVVGTGILAVMGMPALAADKNDDDLEPLGAHFPATVGPHTDNKDAVRIIEKRLGQKPNGVWGDNLTRELKRFQRKRDALEEDGEVGRRTLAALRERDDLPPRGPLTPLQATWLGLEPLPVAEPSPATEEVSVEQTPAPAPEETAPAQSSGAPSGALGSIAQCESGGDYNAVDASGTYHGAYQFDQSTWESVGGSGSPSAASPAEQDRRAQMLLQQSGTSPWPNCG